MKRVELAPLLHVMTSLVVIAIGFWVGPRLPISKDVAKPMGGLIFLLGLAMFAWTVVHLRKAFFGNIEPVGDRLVTSGPYGYVRHPLYLSMVIMLLGLTAQLRGFWGIVGTFVLFLPAAAYRAKLEENALARRFGQQWEDYARRTSFMVPALW